MSPKPLPLALCAVALSLGACVSAPPEFTAPAPAKPVDEARFYTGTWHEIARNPMKITDGCVAGETRFYRDDKGRLIDRDSCREGSPTGKEKVFAGPADIAPDSHGAIFTTHYKIFGPFGVSRTYSILDHGDDYGWFIVATPDFKNLSIFTRDPQIPRAERDRLVARAQALGYDPAKLEFPEQPSS